MMKTLSIVVRARRDSTHLNRCLQSLLEQNYPSELMEIVVVDRRGRLETKQLLRWWMCSGASRRSRPELRYLPVSAVSDESLFFEAARATSGAIIVVVDDLFEAPPRWALSGVAAASSPREPGASNASTDLNGKFLPRSEVLSAGTDGPTERSDFQAPPLPQATATLVEQAFHERSANYAREYVALFLLVATVVCALLGQLRLAMAGLIGWSAISLWLALRLLHLNMRRHGGWKSVLWRPDREMAPAVRISPSSATRKESLDARQN